jgi:methylphosphotriester-DNA--protein-cysteine methyltransferase
MDIKELLRQIEELRDQVKELENSHGEHGLNYYVASSRRSTFHRPSCKWASFIMDSRNLIEFSSHDEAVDAGYKPCKTCCA